MNVKISVIIPVYNMGKYLPECLDSIVRQSLKKIEIIAINDGSTDESSVILEEYSSKYANILVLTQKNQGVGKARNNGIKNATGKYLAFMDPDDFYPDDNCLQELYNAAEENNVSLCGGIIIQNFEGERTIYDEKIVRDFYSNKKVRVQDYVDIYWFQRFIFLSEMIKKNEICFPEYKRFEDPPFLVKAMLHAQEFYGLNKEVYEHRVGHKIITYTLENSADTLRGIRDTLYLAKQNNLTRVYQHKIKNIYKEYIIPFYKYSFVGKDEIDGTIEEINEIVKEWIGNEEDMILTREKVIQVRVSAREEYNSNMQILCEEEKKIIYGAGGNGI